MAAIPRAQFFYHAIDTDIYIVKWQGKKRRIQAIMDEFTRFEAEARVKRETVQCEIKGFEKLWLGCASTPIVLRCDMSGTHMSDEFALWCDGHGINLELIPKAHHKLAIQERNHVVRRNQLFEKLKRLLTPIFNKVCVVASLRGTGLLVENIWSEKQCTIGGKRRKQGRHWFGCTIGMVQEWCARPANLDLSLLDRCYWVVHGSALFRCTHEQMPRNDS